MVALLHVALKDTGSGGFIEASGLQDVCGIDPIVGLPSHNMLPFGVRAGELVLPDWVLHRRLMLAKLRARARRHQQEWQDSERSMRLTPL